MELTPKAIASREARCNDRGTKLPYRFRNEKEKPPWPDSWQSYPVEYEVALVTGCKPGDPHANAKWEFWGLIEGKYPIYKVTVRYERHTGEFFRQTRRFHLKGDALAWARDVMRSYSPEKVS